MGTGFCFEPHWACQKGQDRRRTKLRAEASTRLLRPMPQPHQVYKEAATREATRSIKRPPRPQDKGRGPVMGRPVMWRRNGGSISGLQSPLETLCGQPPGVRSPSVLGVSFLAWSPAGRVDFFRVGLQLPKALGARASSLGDLDPAVCWRGEEPVLPGELARPGIKGTHCLLDAWPGRPGARPDTCSQAQGPLFCLLESLSRG